MKRTTRPHWSFSALNQYLRCPLQYYFERVLKLPRTSVGSGLVFGSAVHSALAVYHQGISEGNKPSLPDVQQAYLREWSEREDYQTIDYRPKENRDSLIDLGIALLELYQREPPPENIVTIEQTVIVPLRNSEGTYLATPMVAVADLITRDDKSLKLTEFKTSGRSYGSFEVDSSLQATCYVHAVHEMFDEWSSVEFAVLVKTKTPKLQRLTTTRTKEHLGRLGDLVENVERAVNSQIFYPVESPLNCSGCSFRKQCLEWKPDRDHVADNTESLNTTACQTC